MTDLLLLPPDQTTPDVLEQLVADRVVEGFTLEYKRELGIGAKTLTGISAIAGSATRVLVEQLGAVDAGRLGRLAGHLSRRCGE